MAEIKGFNKAFSLSTQKPVFFPVLDPAKFFHLNFLQQDLQVVDPLILSLSSSVKKVEVASEMYRAMF